MLLFGVPAMRKSKPTFALIFLAAISSALAAQPNETNTEEAAILSTVDSFFAALARADRNGLEATTRADAEFVISAVDADGEISLSSRSRDEFVSSIANNSAALLERYWDATVLIREGIAVFWAPYDFHVDGNFSHCGIDSFQLFKENGRWKIGNSSYTIERLDCEESPLGAL